MTHAAPAPVVYRAEFENEAWTVRRHGRRRYEVVVELPIGDDTHLVSLNGRTVKLFVGNYRWLWLTKRRCRKGGA